MTSKLYDKANSILELRGINKKREKILETLRKQREKMGCLNATDPLHAVLRDLFENDGADVKSEDKFYLRDHVVEEMSRLDASQYFRYLQYRYSYDIYPAIKKVAEYPPLVQIEPASICNYRCVFCYQIDQRLSNRKNGHMGVMELELFKDVIDQLEGNVEAISLASRGEPTVNKKLPDMLQYMAGKFLATKVNTNAYLLDENMAHSILEADLQTLVFSADAASEPLYSTLRVNGDLDRIVKNIENFHNIRESQYPDSKLITRVSGVKYDDQQDMGKMEGFWEKYVDQVAFVDYNPWENVYDAEKNGVRTPCSDLWRRLFVWWDGRIAPCDVDYLTTLSNDSIQEKSISEIWNGEVHRALREKHLTGKRASLEPCSRCVVV